VGIAMRKQQFNVKLEPELQKRAREAAEELGQQIGVFVARAIESHIGNVKADQRYAANKKGKR
jgi:predicted DNA-binding protein